MQVTGGPDNWQVTPPSWRFDVTIEADLIEELARVTGLDNIPESPVVGQRHIGGGSESQLPERTLLQLLAARGYHESISFGFVDPALQRQLLGERPVIALKNPIASDLAVMRASLWPGLIHALLQNHRRQQERVRLFEIANRFLLDANGTTREQRMVAGIAMGTRLPEQWGAAKQPLDFYDVKADVEAVLAAVGPLTTHRFEPATDVPPGLHPGRCATVVRNGQPIGLIGELHPSLVKDFDLTYAPVLFELDYQAVAGAAPAVYAAISSFPQIRRDISFTVAETEAFSTIIEHVSVAASTRLKELRIFDVYQGKGVESGRKSVALGLILQDLSRTLTDKEADDVVAAVLERLRSKLNARLRE
jgi:phenylalanyl-tRNA synthetase beta chain